MDCAAPDAQSNSSPKLRLLTVAMSAVTSTKIQQRQSVEHCNFLNLTHKNRVVAGRVSLSHFTIEVGESAGDYWSAAPHVVVLDIEPARRIGIALRIGKELGESFLVFAQNANSKTPTLTDVEVGFGQMVNTHQDQRRAK